VYTDAVQFIGDSFEDFIDIMHEKEVRIRLPIEELDIMLEGANVQKILPSLTFSCNLILQKKRKIKTLEQVTDHYVIFIIIGQCACFAHQKPPF